MCTFIALLIIQYVQEAMQSFEPVIIQILTCVFHLLVIESEDIEKSEIYSPKKS